MTGARAEWTKIRTVWSTAATLVPACLLAPGLGLLLGFALRPARLPPEQAARFDPLFAAGYGLTLAELAVVVFGILVMGGEYSSGSIRASLLATPVRRAFYASKVLVATVTMAAAATVMVLGSFGASQLALGPDGTALSSSGVPTAMLGAWLNVILLGLFALGVTAMLRSSVWTLAVLMPLFGLGSQGFGNVPGIKGLTQYLPDQVGQVIMHLTGAAGDPRFGRPYGAWSGIGLLAGWTTAALVGGYLVLRRRDAG